MDNWPYSPENDDDSPDSDAGSSDLSMDDADADDFGPGSSPEKPLWEDEGEMTSTPAMTEKPKARSAAPKKAARKKTAKKKASKKKVSKNKAAKKKT